MPRRGPFVVAGGDAGAVAENLIHARDGYRCAVTGRPAESVHHRIHGDRSLNRPANLLSVSGSGVTGGHGFIEANWQIAAGAGWTVSKHDCRDLAEIPVFLIAGPFGQGWYLLDDNARAPGFRAWPGSVVWQEAILTDAAGNPVVLARLPRPALPRMVRA